MKVDSLNIFIIFVFIMNKPEAHNNLIPVRDYTYITRRGHKASVQYIYRLIKEHKTGLREVIPFRYIEIDKAIWIQNN